MKYFLDTEFHEHKKPIKFCGITIDNVNTIDLISIGIVAEDGREYYAINKDLNWKYALKDDWIRKNVLDDFENEPETTYKTIHQILLDILYFISPKDGEPIEFYGYYSAYDWVSFCWIFGKMLNLPKGMPMYCNDLKQMLDYKLRNKRMYLSKDFNLMTLPLKDGKDKIATLEGKIKYISRHKDYPQKGLYTEHNALSDAKWNKDLFNFINLL